jgi:hypothetical protein
VLGSTPRIPKDQNSDVDRPTIDLMSDRNTAAEEIADANPSPTDAQIEPALRPKPSGHADFSGIRAVFFDLDDTLCGYWDASKFGMRRAFELHGPEGFTVDDMVRAWAAAFREFSPTLKQTGWYDGYLKNGEPTRTEQMRLTLMRLGVMDEARAQALSQSYMEERDRALRLFEDSEFVLQKL